MLLAVVPLMMSAENYPSLNVNMIGHWYNPTQDPEPIYGIQYQGVWGWHQQSLNREYAILGASDGTYFLDVTTPSNPVVVDYIPAAHGNLIWHEIKTYQNYCYIVSDDGAPNTFIICDLNSLPDSVTILHNNNTIFERCHTIYVDGTKLWCGSVTGDNNAFQYSMACYDLSVNPAQPTLIRALDQDYPAIGSVHDMFVRNDTVYASCGYEGLHIYTFGSVYTEIGFLTTYPEQGYNHSSFLTPGGNTLIFMDEVPDGRGIKSVDVSNMGNITVNQVFRSNTGNTPHNPYILGANILVGANYTDGLQLWNISNPSAVVPIGYFDSDTLVNYPNYTDAYHGCWGAYTDLPSGLILIGDMQNGLFVLDISQALATSETMQPAVSASAYPNPFNSDFYVNVSTSHDQMVKWTVVDAAGRTVLTSSQNVPAGPAILEIPAAELAKGMYSVLIESEELHAAIKLVKE